MLKQVTFTVYLCEYYRLLCNKMMKPLDKPLDIWSTEYNLRNVQNNYLKQNAVLLFFTKIHSPQFIIEKDESIYS